MTPRGLMVHTTDDSLGELQDSLFSCPQGSCTKWRRSVEEGSGDGTAGRKQALGTCPTPKSVHQTTLIGFKQEAEPR